MKSNLFVVLISGRGSNLEAICKSGLYPQIACVISNNPQALGLEIAHQFKLKTYIVNHNEYNTREAFEQQIATIIDLYHPKLIVLAGFMRILSPWFIHKYPQQIINIHPSILPAFTGARAQQDAIMAQVKVSGATVHFVTTDLDHGPIIAQGVVQTKDTDNTNSLSLRILELEHSLDPFIINKILQDKISITPNGYVLVNKEDSDKFLLNQFYPIIFY